MNRSRTLICRCFRSLQSAIALRFSCRSLSKASDRYRHSKRSSKRLISVRASPRGLRHRRLSYWRSSRQGIELTRQSVFLVLAFWLEARFDRRTLGSWSALLDGFSYVVYSVTSFAFLCFIASTAWSPLENDISSLWQVNLSISCGIVYLRAKVIKNILNIMLFFGWKSTNSRI